MKKEDSNKIIEVPKIVGIKEAARLAGLSTVTLQTAMNRGLLKAIRPTGKSRYIRLVDLIAWLNGETQTNTNAAKGGEANE